VSGHLALSSETFATEGRHAGEEVFALGKDAAAETKASHEVMDLVRQNRELSLMAFKLHEAGRSWPAVKAAVEAKRKTAKRSSDVLR
jgi:hypothetical protein